MQVSDGRAGGCCKGERHRGGVPGADSAAHSGQRLRAHVSRLLCIAFHPPTLCSPGDDMRAESTRDRPSTKP